MSNRVARFRALFRKDVLETLRDWKILVMALTFAPFFVLLMYGYLGHATPTYDVALVDQDRGGGEGSLAARESRGLLRALEEVVSPEGDTLLFVREAGLEEARTLLRDRRVDVVVVVPEDFTRAILRQRSGLPGEPATVRTLGDPGNPSYLMAAVWVDMVALGYAGFSAGVESPVTLDAQTVTGISSLDEFELYVPALLVLAIMMLMFTAAAALIREKDKRTLVRLRMSNMTVVEWLAAVSTTQVLLGVGAVGLTYLTALTVGYRSAAPMAALLVVTALCSLSVMAFSVLVAAYLRTIFDLVTVGCFPFFVLMFFSGGMFPLPGVSLFRVGDRVVELNEVLPTTHGVAAMSKVLSFGAGLGEVTYELAAMAALTVVFFGVGTWIFRRRHMPAVG